MTTITYIANSTIPSRAANSIHVMKMCEAMAELGCGVELIYPVQGAGEDVTDGDLFFYYGVRPVFRLHLLARPFRRGARLYFAIGSALRARLRGSKLAYCRNHWAGFFCALVGIDTVFEAHAPLAEDDQRGEEFFRRLIRSSRFRQLFVITRSLRDHYVARFPELAGKILVLPDAASPIPADIEPVRLDECAQSFKVGYAGQLYRGKGMELIARLAPLSPGISFHVVGGLDADIEYWKRECARMNNVYFHGYVAHARVPAYIKAMDAVLLPNQAFVSAHGSGNRNISEWTSPLKAFEYMAAGKAIVASDLPALREVLRDEDNALLCRPDAPEQWRSAIERLIVEPGLKDRLECAALKDFESQYSWRARAQRVLEIVG